jgi:translation elongation factor EF-1beta
MTPIITKAYIKQYPTRSFLLTKKRTAVATSAAAEEEDDDIDLFGSDDEEVDEEAERVKAQRLAEYAAKKANKPKTIAKTTVSLDVKPWDDETNMEELTAAVKAIEMDGLIWGGSQLVPIGYGIKKLQINCVVEDDKVSKMLLSKVVIIRHVFFFNHLSTFLCDNRSCLTIFLTRSPNLRTMFSPLMSLLCKRSK